MVSAAIEQTSNIDAAIAQTGRFSSFASISPATARDLSVRASALRLLCIPIVAAERKSGVEWNYGEFTHSQDQVADHVRRRNRYGPWKSRSAGCLGPRRFDLGRRPGLGHELSAGMDARRRHEQMLARAPGCRRAGRFCQQRCPSHPIWTRCTEALPEIAAAGWQGWLWHGLELARTSHSGRTQGKPESLS